MGRAAENRENLLRQVAVAAGCIGLVLVGATCWQQSRATAKTTLPALPEVDVPIDLGKTAYAHVEKIVAFGARSSGTPGWERQLDYITKTLRAAGLEPRRDRWTDDEEALVFENIAVTIQGQLPDKIVIACHHDTKNTHGHPDPADNFEFVGANDGASAVGLLLALAPVLKQRELQASIELVFFDGEESVPFDWDIDRALFGSRRFVRQYTDRVLESSKEPPIRAMVLLDMVGAKDLTIDNETKSDQRLKDIVLRAAQSTGNDRYFFKLDEEVTDDHVPFINAGIPAVDLIDIADNPQWHTPDDTIEHISAESMQIVGTVVLTALPEIERQYVTERSRLKLRDR